MCAKCAVYAAIGGHGPAAMSGPSTLLFHTILPRGLSQFWTQVPFMGMGPQPCPAYLQCFSTPYCPGAFPNFGHRCRLWTWARSHVRPTYSAFPHHTARSACRFSLPGGPILRWHAFGGMKKRPLGGLSHFFLWKIFPKPFSLASLPSSESSKSSSIWRCFSDSFLGTSMLSVT